MIVDHRTAMYLMYVAGALEEHRVPERYLTNQCPECGDELELTYDMDNPHVMMPVREYATPAQRHAANDYTVYVIIACEGYWVVNPNDVGVPTDTWNDWTVEPLGDPVTGVHDGSCAGNHADGAPCNA